MDKHIKNDKVISEKEVRKIESKLNRHMESWVKNLQPGESINQSKRIKSNLITKDSQVPILRGTSKDHKKADNKNIGPDVRPIMGAVVWPNIGLSEIGSNIVRKIADNADVGLVAKSTEEVINKIESYNKRRIEDNLGDKKIIVASMDIEKFSNNIISEKSAQIIRKMYEESELIIEGIDIDKLARYLGTHMKKEEIAEEGFEDLVYTKEKKQKKIKVTKKVGRKFVKNKKNTRESLNKVKDNSLDTLDSNNSDEGADTLKLLLRRKMTQKLKRRRHQYG